MLCAAPESIAAAIAVGGSVFSATITAPSTASVTAADGSFAPPASWYRRSDRNGWRLVTVPVTADGTETEIVSKRSLPHHISRAKRRVDVERLRKQRKRQWLMNMYREGLAKENEGSGAAEDKESASGMVFTTC